MAWVCILELPLTGFVPLSKTRNLSVPQFFICKKGSNNSTCLPQGATAALETTRTQGLRQ